MSDKAQPQNTSKGREEIGFKILLVIIEAISIFRILICVVVMGSNYGAESALPYMLTGLIIFVILQIILFKNKRVRQSTGLSLLILIGILLTAIVTSNSSFRFFD